MIMSTLFRYAVVLTVLSHIIINHQVAKSTSSSVGYYPVFKMRCCSILGEFNSTVKRVQTE